MKKLRTLSLALACLGVVLICLAASQGSTGTAVVSGQTGQTKTKPAKGQTASANGLSHEAGVTVGNKSVPVPTALAKSATRPYFRRAGTAVVNPDGKRYALKIYHALSLPNDPSANQPWVALANIDGAWGTPRSGSPTLLAIVDTGFDLQHEEFQGRWYTNTGEIAGNGVDDDGNGLVDDTRGWDFANGDNDVQAQAEGRHGTFVAGVAAATGNNGKGIAGVDWGTTILPIQALGEDGSGYNSDVANGIIYAADQGADVISLSLGSSEADPVVRQAVDYAISKGSIVVAAAGNDGCDCMSYPANYPEVLSVGATDGNNQLAGFSSYGANLDVVAPGVNLYTTDWQSSNPTSAYAGGISGTSLSTPIISGLLTRLKSQQPTATPLQLIAALTENVNRLGMGLSAPRSDQYGYGLVDGGKATNRMAAPYSPPIMYGFGEVSVNDSLTAAAPPFQGAAIPYGCLGSDPGSTPIYKLTNGAGTLSYYSASTYEVEQAKAADYSVQFFQYACLSEPQDRPATVRLLNVKNEYEN
jgi:hypothetical protein